MNVRERIKNLFKKKSVKIGVIVVLALAVVVIINSDNADTPSELEVKKSIVSITSPSEYAGNQSLSLIGSVRAFTEADITSERAGRVTSVNVTLGQEVLAGTILATLENASERAAVLQAEGVYDAAVVAAAQSDIGVDESNTGLTNAKNSAVSTYKSAYNTTNGIIVNSIDAFFANPNDSVPGLRIDGRGFTLELNQKRVEFQTSLALWLSRANSISSDSDLEVELDYASQSVQDTIDMIDTFILIFNQQESSSRYSDAELIAFSDDFTGLRSSLIGVQSSIDGSKTALATAEDAVKRAELSAVGGTASAADAQAKQALGSLRAAQANYAKTILRTPISGTVNSLSLRTGDFINSFASVAVVANNDALEIVTYISDNELSLLNDGDKVLVEGQFDGTVTEIAPAVDKLTGKTEVRIATEGIDIANGDTVRVTKEVSSEELVGAVIRVPLTAVKFDRENGSVFTIVEGKLQGNEVELGNITGNSVEIVEGISLDDLFVVDSRGLIAGEEVIVAE